MRVLAGFLLAVALAPAQSRQERGKAIVDAALEALGGKRFLAMQDRVETGRAYSFFREELSGLARAKIYTRYLTPPEPRVPQFFGLRERQAFGKNEDYSVLFTEKDCYQISFRGARPMQPQLVERFRDSTLRNIFYILRQRLGEPGLLFEFQRTDVFLNQPVELVDITDAENLTVTVYFHASTKLPVRQVFFRRDPKTRERHEEVTLFGKYRDVGGGVQWPFTIERKRDGERIFEMYAESVVVNQGLTDQLFTLPANMKILPMAR